MKEYYILKQMMMMTKVVVMNFLYKVLEDRFADVIVRILGKLDFFFFSLWCFQSRRIKHLKYTISVFYLIHVWHTVNLPDQLVLWSWRVLSFLCWREKLRLCAACRNKKTSIAHIVDFYKDGLLICTKFGR